MIAGTGISLALGFGAALAATSLHFECLTLLTRYLDNHLARPRRAILLSLSGVLIAHLVEIALFAGAFSLGSGPLNLGVLSGMRLGSPSAFFYVAAETYSSLGYGDVVPTRSLRLLAALTSLSGILLLAWSGSFLFALAQRLHGNRKPH